MVYYGYRTKEKLRHLTIEEFENGIVVVVGIRLRSIVRRCILVNCNIFSKIEIYPNFYNFYFYPQLFRFIFRFNTILKKKIKSKYNSNQVFFYKLPMLF